MSGDPGTGAVRRIHWFEGRLLTAADLAAEQEYHPRSWRRCGPATSTPPWAGSPRPWRAEKGPRDDPAVVLANVTVADDGGLEVDDCGPRRVLPTNRLLARLVAALAGAGAPSAVTAPATDGGRPLT